MKKSNRDEQIAAAIAALAEGRQVGNIPSSVLRHMVESGDWSTLDDYPPEQILSAKSVEKDD